MLSRASPRPLAFLRATLGEPLHEKPGMTHFLPASVSWHDTGTASVRVKWKARGIPCRWRRRIVFWWWEQRLRIWRRARMLKCGCVETFYRIYVVDGIVR